MTITYAPGQNIPVVYQDNYTLQAEGDLTNVDVWIGVPYAQKFTFSTQYTKRQGANGGAVPNLAGRLQYRRWKLIFRDCHTFRVEVTPQHRDTYQKVFNAAQVGNSYLDTVDLQDGEFSFLVPAKNDQVDITVINDTIWPSKFLSAEFEAEYFSRSRGM